MGRDIRWGFVPFIVTRILQLLFAVIVLGLNADLISNILSVGLTPGWMFGFGLFVAVATLIWCIIAISLFFTSHLMPVAVVVLDAILLFLWLISMIGMGIAELDGDNLLTYDCNTCVEDDFGFTSCLLPAIKTLCEIIKANFAFELLTLILFIASLTIAGITLHRTKGHKASEYAEDGVVVQHTIPMQPVPVGVEQPGYHEQQPVQGGYYTQQ